MAADTIVVDDGPQDGTWDALDTFGDRIRKIRIDHAGVSAARNHGWRSARGEWVKFHDSDDQLAPGAVGALVEATQAAPARTIPFGDARSIDVDDAVIQPFGYGHPGAPAHRPLDRGGLLSATMFSFLPLFPRDALRDREGSTSPSPWVRTRNWRFG